MKKIFVLVLIGCAFLSVTCAASESAETGIPRAVFFQALNFFGLLVILYFLVKKKVGAFFRKRHETLTAAMSEARRLREEVEKRHQEYSVRIEGLEKEAQQSLEQIRREGAEMKRRLIDEAKRLAENIDLEAKRTVENEVARARAELYDETLSEALEGARILLGKSVAETDQRRLQKEFVEKIEVVQ